MATVSPRITWLIVLTLLVPISVASAQEPPSLRAAPPREPDVLRAVPDPDAVAQEYRDIGGRWIGSSDAAMQSLGKAGGTLTNIVTGKFSGLSNTIAVADWSAPLGALSAGDVRGAVSGAVAIKVGATVTSSGAALFGEAGAVLGGAVGSFFPVVGNIAGSMIGGAVGTTAGGFICAFGYDKYVKDYVARGVLVGIAAVIDPLPMAEMRAKMDALMLQTMSPEQRAMLETSSTFGSGEVQLLDFGTQSHVPAPKQPALGVPTPDAQQQAVLPPGGPSTVTGNIQINPDTDYVRNCTIAGGKMRCEMSWAAGISQYHWQFEGTISGSTAIGNDVTIEDVRSHDGCRLRVRWGRQVRYDFEDGGRVRVTESQATTSVVSHTCSGGPPPLTLPGSSSVDTWRARP